MAISTGYRKQLIDEVKTFPEEDLLDILQMMRLFRENETHRPEILQMLLLLRGREEDLPLILRLLRECVGLKTAADSFKQGWAEAQRGELSPLATLWDGIDDK